MPDTCSFKSLYKTVQTPTLVREAINILKGLKAVSDKQQVNLSKKLEKNLCRVEIINIWGGKGLINLVEEEVMSFFGYRTPAPSNFVDNSCKQWWCLRFSVSSGMLSQQVKNQENWNYYRNVQTSKAKGERVFLLRYWQSQALSPM